MKDEESKEKLYELQGRSPYEEAPLWARIILAFVSLFFPGLGQAIGKRHTQTFDFLMLYGASLLVARVFIIQLNRGIIGPVLMVAVLLMPSLWSAFDALLNRKSPGDSEEVVRNIFFYIMLYLVMIGPFYLVNQSFGYKIERLDREEIYMVPRLLPGDAIIVDRDAYLSSPISPRENQTDSIAVGDIVYHHLVPEDAGGDNMPVHYVLAAPGDILEARDTLLLLNGNSVDLPINKPYAGGSFGPLVVPGRQVFLVDNRWRFFPIYQNKIRGRVTGILWSRKPDDGFRFGRFGTGLERSDIIGKKIEPEPLPEELEQANDSI